MKAMRFQEATAAAVLDAFKREGGSRRFLVADEVGLGKTVVARRVFNELLHQNPARTLHVLYVCSNLAVAAQNRKALLSELSEEQRKLATVPVDRLSLVTRRPELWQRENVGGQTPLRLFTLTPGTSLPDWSTRRSGGGTMYERATIQALIERACGDHFHNGALAQRESANWQGHLDGARAHFKNSSSSLGDMAELRNWIVKLTGWSESSLLSCALAEASQLRPRAKRWDCSKTNSQLADRLGVFRTAACLLALDLICPDLIIFDEFQRFPELVTVHKDARPADPRKDILVSRFRSDSGEQRTPMLLLSATPYRLARHAEAAAHDDFLAVTRFLLGGSVVAGGFQAHAANKIELLSEGLNGLREAFVSGVVDDTARGARDKAQSVLRLVMARTERSDELRLRQQKPVARKRKPVTRNSRNDVKLTTTDLLVFKHMVALRRHREPNGSADVAYWTSIPLPTQTMAGYKSATILKGKGDPKPPAKAYMSAAALEKLDAGPVSAHPKLRSLLAANPPATLALPWVAPSLPWWPLRGGWASTNKRTAGPTKILAFSRFVAVPRAVPALISHAVESAVFTNNKRPKRLPSAFEASVRGSTKYFALFLPVPGLAWICDPLPLRDAKDYAAILQALTTQLDRFLTTHLGQLGKKFKVVQKQRRQPISKLLAKLCGMSPDKIGVGLAQAELPSALPPETRTAWGRGVAAGNCLNLLTVTRRELERLAEVLAFGPGNMLHRVLDRHGAANACEVAALSWTGMRARLGHAVAMAALQQPQKDTMVHGVVTSARPGAALCRAIYDGNLESALDEHFWLLLRQYSTADAVEELRRQLTPLRGHVEFATTSDKNPTLRTHVAMPFRTDGTSGGAKKSAKKSAALEPGADLADRPDLIRSVFNSPFWPHILVTTSVGQEGLDFHPWCAAIAHWDLPGSAVDYEQREGRIQRYAGLAVRRGIATSQADKKVEIFDEATAARSSPWGICVERVEQAGDQNGKGLSPWWTYPDSDIERQFPAVEGSEMLQDRKRLDEERELYRLVLGQPDQKQLVERLLRVGPAAMQELRLRLSPAYSQTAVSTTLKN